MKGFELIILLILCAIYGCSYNSSIAYFIFSVSMIWFVVGSWLFAPFVFNPSGFEWQKIVDDWTDWNKWIMNSGGIGVPPERSWESWWEEEQEHLRFSGKCGCMAEILLALRFFILQYGLVYHLSFVPGQSILVLVNSLILSFGKIACWIIKRVSLVHCRYMAYHGLWSSSFCL